MKNNGQNTKRLIQENASPDIITMSILTDLNNAMTDEFLAMYQYFAETRIVESKYKPFIIKELKQHAMEEYKHAGMIANRIMELGGKIITNPSILFSSTSSACGYTEPTTSDPYQIITEADKGEQCAIKTYTLMADNAKQIGDIQTYDMFQKIIKDEIEHSKDLNNLILNFQIQPTL